MRAYETLARRMEVNLFIVMPEQHAPYSNNVDNGSSLSEASILQQAASAYVHSRSVQPQPYRIAWNTRLKQHLDRRLEVPIRCFDVGTLP